MARSKTRNRPDKDHSRTHDSAEEMPTILIVDDEEPILQLAAAALERQGFRVITALSGRQALTAAEEHGGPIDLLLIDVVMPDINGPELAEELRGLVPDARLIFTSGYGSGASAALEKRHDGALYLSKPFGIDQLERRVQEALG